MLVLTRKPHEKVQIGDHITITVLKTKGKSVRLGIEAPADVPVLRGELTVNDAAESRSDDQQSEVSFARAPKSRVTTILPDLLGDAGPLREMLVRRGEASAC